MRKTVMYILQVRVSRAMARGCFRPPARHPRETSWGSRMASKERECVTYMSCCYGKISHKSNLREKSFVLAHRLACHGLRVQSIVARKSRGNEMQEGRK